MTHAGEGDAAGAGQVKLPSSGLRSVLTLLLLLHLFALFVAVVSNFGARSGLRLQLREVPGVRPYLQLLNMDTAWNYHLVFGTREDRDFHCEVVLQPGGRSSAAESGGGDRSEVIPLMPADVWPGSRGRRYLMLAYNTAANAGSDQVESVLPAALASGMLRQRGVSEGTHLFRCLGLEPASRDAAASQRPQREPLPRVVYEADLLPGTSGWEPVKRSDVTERTESRSAEDQR
ncbi:MAG: hypothetical protein GTO53_14590 [Planctomycetales bacterium]|nr:hypothetical protein [Planctomycetales bacterium]NIM10310.1 hypothetical protein [Planctomycetales bacterium]NIN09750.1 hypothetical protein [Planctomycetales bacterium]NIN78875.1 hypothetical protein [Planctomycetales bacterium]NIO36042.1 hypothetical protein [Planctomycetales bacterium]